MNLTTEQKELFDGIVEEIGKKSLTAEQVKSLISDQIKDINKSEIEELKATALEQANAIKNIEEKADTKEKTFSEIVKEQHDKAKENLNKGINAKISIPMSAIKTVLPAGLVSNSRGLYLPGYGQIATQSTGIVDLFSQFAMGAGSNRTIYYMDQTSGSITRGAAARTVGDSAGASAITWTRYSATLESISDSIPIAKEMIDGSYEGLEAEIRNFIINNMMIKRDNAFVTGTGVTPEIKGIYTYATAFNSAAYTGFKPINGNLYDLIVIMATEIMKSTKYVVNTVIINPADALRLKLAKDELGGYLKPFIMNGESIGNIRVVESASQAANTLTIGDFTYARRYFGSNLELDMNYNASGDFAKRIVTLLGNMEEMLLVRNCEADAFLKSTDITTDVANITIVTA